MICAPDTVSPGAVSLSQQKVDVYRGLTRISSSKVSTGMRGYATKAGVFSVLEKRRHHRSNLYSGAPMPWMNRITWSGTALHAGVVPGYPASHGCIRLPRSFAPKLFKMTTVGVHVVVVRNGGVPALFELSALFQPLPPPLHRRGYCPGSGPKPARGPQTPSTALDSGISRNSNARPTALLPGSL